jgi:hypothetical protein
VSELLKRDLSLTVLKVRLIDLAARELSEASGSYAPDSAPRMRVPRVYCQLQITGKPNEGEWTDPTSPSEATQGRMQSRASKRYETGGITPPARARNLAEWTLLPQEILLPIKYDNASRYTEKPYVGSWLADAARGTVSSLASDRTVRSLERFAANASWLPTGRSTLPLNMGHELQGLLASVLRDDDCLWLELTEPLGYLPVLPWEEMLAPYVKAPILRLSPYPLELLAPESKLSIVLCISVPLERSPQSTDALGSLMYGIGGGLPQGSTLHVFADEQAHEMCAKAARRPSNDGAPIIKVYDLPTERERDASDEAWTAWVAEALGGKAADIVHLYGSALMYSDGPRLIAIRDPGRTKAQPSRRSGKDAAEGGRPLRYLTSVDVSKFLTQFGAWGAVFSLPARAPDQSRIALRFMTDQVGRARPGAAVFHDAAADSQYTALTAAYRFMTGDATVKPPHSAAVSVCCNPANAMRVPPPPLQLPAELQMRLEQIRNSLKATAQREHALPTWMAALQRAVEQSVSRVASAQSSSNNDAAMRGISAALKHVEDAFAQRSLRMDKPEHGDVDS